MNPTAEPTTAFAGLGDEFRRMWGLPPRDAQAPSPKPVEIDVAALVRAQRMESFKKLCPVHFQAKIDRTKIPNLSAWDEADKWDGAFPGLWLWSHETGEAKTRFLWRKFGVFHVDKGRSVVRVTGLNLAEEYNEAYMKGTTQLFYARFGRIECVMLDDLDKMELPDPDHGFAQQDRAARNARFLREMFDTFYEEHTPVLVTANEPISWFAERIGKSAERRMRECCKEIAL